MTLRIEYALICNFCGQTERKREKFGNWTILTAAAHNTQDPVSRGWERHACPACWNELVTNGNRFPLDGVGVLPDEEDTDHGTQFEYECNDCRCDRCLQWYRDSHGEEIPEDMMVPKW
jgi:hypothetical protein